MSPQVARRWCFPWPSKRERKAAVDAAERAYERTVRERRGLEAAVERLREARESNHFRERFEAALKGQP
jgi:hypothetical protein